MSVATVSTYGSLQTLLQNVNQVQNELNTDQEQVSSGLVSQTFDGLNGSVEQFTALNAQIARLTNYQQGNSTIISQLNTTSTTLGQIEQLGTSIKGLIASQLSGTASTASFNQQMSAYQTTLVGQLNTTYGNNYIFSGTKTDTQPVQTPLPAVTSPGTVTNDYYQGNDESSTQQISDSQSITNNINAGNTAFQQLFAGIAQALQADGSTSQLESAENLISSGTQGVIALQATANANVVAVQNVDTQSQSIQTYYQGVTQSMSQANVVAVSTQVAQDQTVLQASFETFARISSLSLANYLK